MVPLDGNSHMSNDQTILRNRQRWTLVNRERWGKHMPHNCKISLKIWLSSPHLYEDKGNLQETQKEP